MTKTRTLPSQLIAIAAVCGLCGCAAEAQQQARGEALQGSASAAADADRDVDERIDETTDVDDDVDEQVDEANDTDSDEDFDLQLTELPQAVQATAQAAVGTGAITGIDRDRGPTGIEYEIEFVRDGVEYEVEIAADGTELNTKRD